MKYAEVLKLVGILNEETEKSYADALYSRIFKKAAQEHTDGNNNAYIALNTLRASLDDKKYINSESKEEFNNAKEFANAVCNYYATKYPENYKLYSIHIKNAAIDRYNRH